MRQFHTAVIERRERFTGTFASQPHEVGWASEAIWFVRIEAVERVTGDELDAPGSGAATDPASSGGLDLHVQVSVDGTRWLDEGSSLRGLTGEGDHFMRVGHFGGWLRLRGEVHGGVTYTLTAHLVLKE